jgi:hypothetical protein
MRRARELREPRESSKPLKCEAVEAEPKLARLRAPWTAKQVDALNAYQRSGAMHPFTCPGHGRGDRTLVATRRGWICVHCDYTQDWAHAFMADPLQAGHAFNAD